MGTITAKGKLLHYLKTPLYMFILYFVGSLVLLFYSRRVGAISLSLACISSSLKILGQSLKIYSKSADIDFMHTLKISAVFLTR